jgi:hypothetical protein
VRLSAIQELVKRAATSRDALPSDAAWSERAREAIAGSARLSPVEQLEIYREQFWGRHLGSLEDDFVIAKYLLGDAGYFELTMAYLEAQLPTTYDLRALGRGLPAFVASRAPYAGDALLVESVRLDWAFMEAFDAPDAPAFDTSMLASVPEDAWPGARVRFHPSLRPMSLAYSLAPLRDAIRRGEAPERPAPEATHVAVYRRIDWLRWSALEPQAFALLERLAAGEALGAACEAVSEGDAEALGAKLGSWFAAWTTEGWIANVEV